MTERIEIPPPDFKDDILTRILCYILDTVDEHGCWGAADFENWGPVITALTSGLLLKCGFALDTNWVVGTSTPPKYANLLGTLSFLNSRIRADGTFGEDVWDATQLCQLIHKYDLGKHFDQLPVLNKYIDRYIEARSYREKQKTWDGPGTIASLLRVSEVRGDEQNASQLFDELQKLQLDTGEFHGTIGEDGNDLSSPVWHTAQALIAFLDRGISEKDSRVTNAVKWLVRTQTSEGAWRAFHRYDVYYTAYGVTALSRLANPPEALPRAISWLRTQVAPSGKVADAGGTLMAGLALGAIDGFRFEGALKGSDYHNARKLSILSSTLQSDLSKAQAAIKEKEQENISLQSQLQTWEKRFGGADFGVSTKMVFILGLLVAIAFGGGLLGVSKIIDVLFHCPACHSVEAPKPLSSPQQLDSQKPTGANELPKHLFPQLPPSKPNDTNDLPKSTDQ